jgi:hypothetical protein
MLKPVPMTPENMALAKPYAFFYRKHSQEEQVICLTKWIPINARMIQNHRSPFLASFWVLTVCLKYHD